MEVNLENILSRDWSSRCREDRESSSIRRRRSRVRAACGGLAAGIGRAGGRPPALASRCRADTVALTPPGCGAGCRGAGCPPRRGLQGPPPPARSQPRRGEARPGPARLARGGLARGPRAWAAESADLPPGRGRRWPCPWHCRSNRAACAGAAQGRDPLPAPRVRAVWDTAGGGSGQRARGAPGRPSASAANCRAGRWGGKGRPPPLSPCPEACRQPPTKVCGSTRPALPPGGWETAASTRACQHGAALNETKRALFHLQAKYFREKGHPCHFPLPQEKQRHGEPQSKYCMEVNTSCMWTPLLKWLRSRASYFLLKIQMYQITDI
ncbi:collagen alpha-1(I) chain isoform X1 [Harpia harpyja]|uniref:collagen alpha-1(I) chain isoform X1 n=1 Tax=Harpia harpyja TaxID=202280 RepID=UPI0022B08451|nr:collagen alpha-1(I) chain isoform X1 [Harpia harpyja]XP_052654348.1 collagen alpha-1(I) chain isoform X1 [Harpia harpyja]XP_052654349.1 collagen alpha-1(I) chain isoform X1 [Harpia harpyja]XP_052654351.1 collagen alpha-1(I) chain isoform X1 [Harpia harpyja]